MTNTTFDDLGLSVMTQQDDGASRLTTYTYYDALGRVNSAIDGAGHRIQKAYRYGTGGVSYELGSNPYISTSDPTMGWTLTTRQMTTPGTPFSRQPSMKHGFRFRP